MHSVRNLTALYSINDIFFNNTVYISDKTIMNDKLGSSDGLIPRPNSPADCVKDQETEEATKVQHRAVGGWMDGWMDGWIDWNGLDWIGLYCHSV
jgi:hypothetical protein